MRWREPISACTFGAIVTCPMIPWPWLGLLY